MTKEAWKEAIGVIKKILKETGQPVPTTKKLRASLEAHINKGVKDSLTPLPFVEWLEKKEIKDMKNRTGHYVSTIEFNGGGDFGRASEVNTFIPDLRKGEKLSDFFGGKFLKWLRKEIREGRIVLRREVNR